MTRRIHIGGRSFELAAGPRSRTARTAPSSGDDLAGIGGLLADPIAMAELRAAYAEWSLGAAVHRMSDRAVLHHVVREMQAGRIRLVVPRPARRGAPPVRGTPSVVPDEPPQEAAPTQPPPEPEPEEPTDEERIDARRQAVTLKTAAKNGTPFCEQCAKAAAAAR